MQSAARHPHRALDDGDVLRSGPQEGLLIALTGITFLGGDKTGGELGPGGPLSHIAGHLGPILHPAGHKDRDVPLVFLPEGGQRLQHLPKQLGERPGASLLCLKGLLLGEAQMPAGEGALQHHEVGNTLEVPVPEPADDRGGTPAADHRGQGGVALRNLGGDGWQVPGQAGPADHSVHPSLQGGADTVRVLGSGDHGVDSHHAGSAGQLFGPLDLACQGPKIGLLGIAVKIRLLEAAGRCGDSAHPAFGGHRPGQPVQADSNAHPALKDG